MDDSPELLTPDAFTGLLLGVTTGERHQPPPELFSLYAALLEELRKEREISPAVPSKDEFADLVSGIKPGSTEGKARARQLIETYRRLHGLANRPSHAARVGIRDRPLRAARVQELRERSKEVLESRKEMLESLTESSEGTEEVQPSDSIGKTLRGALHVLAGEGVTGSAVLEAELRMRVGLRESEPRVAPRRRAPLPWGSFVVRVPLPTAKEGSGPDLAKLKILAAERRLLPTDFRLLHGGADPRLRREGIESVAAHQRSGEEEGGASDA